MSSAAYKNLRKRASEVLVVWNLAREARDMSLLVEPMERLKAAWESAEKTAKRLALRDRVRINCIKCRQHVALRTIYVVPDATRWCDCPTPTLLPSIMLPDADDSDWTFRHGYIPS